MKRECLKSCPRIEVLAGLEGRNLPDAPMSAFALSSSIAIRLQEAAMSQVCAEAETCDGPVYPDPVEVEVPRITWRGIKMVPKLVSEPVCGALIQIEPVATELESL